MASFRVVAFVIVSALTIGVVLIYLLPEPLAQEIESRAGTTQVLVEVLGFAAAIVALRYIALEFQQSQRKPELQLSLESDKPNTLVELSRAEGRNLQRVNFYVRNSGTRESRSLAAEISFDRKTAEAFGLTSVHPDRLLPPPHGQWTGGTVNWEIEGRAKWVYRFFGGEGLIAYAESEGLRICQIPFTLGPDYEDARSSPYVFNCVLQGTKAEAFREVFKIRVT